MNKRAILVIASVLVLTSVGYGSANVQQNVPVPTPAPTPQVAQKPVSLPAPPASQKPPTFVQPSFPQASAPFAANVRVDVTITDQTATGTPIKKTVSLTANRSGSVRAGVNVPIPSQSPASGFPIPTVSYSYRTMGLNLDVMEVEVRENTIRLRLNLEYSPLDESEKPGAPASPPVSYSNFSQTFGLVLENGKPIVAAVSSDPVPNRNRTLSVEVKATILK